MNDQILTILIKNDALNSYRFNSYRFNSSSFNDWFNEWGRDFFVDDYQFDIWYGEVTCMYVPVDQIRPDKLIVINTLGSP